MTPRGLLQAFVRSQVRLSQRFDRWCFPEWTVDGNSDFARRCREIDWRGRCVADIGGGKRPFFGVDDKRRLGLRCIGVDIDADELARAPEGAYDTVLVSDVARLDGPPEADAAICQSLLEHVRDNRAGFAGIASLCKPGALVYTFCPCRNAWFARANRFLPESLKRGLLFGIFPHMRQAQGFPAFYDRCTPEDFRRIAVEAGLEVVEERRYFTSDYFMFFFPLYLFWRFSTWLPMKWWPERHCETFSFVFRKRTEAPPR